MTAPGCYCLLDGFGTPVCLQLESLVLPLTSLPDNSSAFASTAVPVVRAHGEGLLPPARVFNITFQKALSLATQQAL